MVHPLKSCWLTVGLTALTLGSGSFVQGQTLVTEPLHLAQSPQSSEADRLFNEGMALFKQGTAESYQQAIAIWQEALNLYEQENNQPQIALTSMGIGFIQEQLGYKREALSYFEKSLALYRILGDEAGQAGILNNIGLVYSGLGEKKQALAYYQEALNLWLIVDDLGGEAYTLNNMGQVYDDLGEKKEALEYYQQALFLLRSLGNLAGQAINLSNIGLVYSDLGEKQQALDYYQQALSLSRTVEDKAGEATILNSIGAVYGDLGEKKQALEYYQQSLLLRRAVGDRAGEAVTLSGIGLIYNALGEKHQALEYYRQALLLSRAVGDLGAEGITLNNIGLAYDSLGEKQEALHYYQQALPLKQTVGDYRGEAITLSNIGAIYSDLGEKKQAFDYYQQALTLSQAVGDRSTQAGILYNMAYLEKNRGNLPAALSPMQESIAILEDLRTKIDSKELRQTYFATVQDYYQFYIDLLMELHQQDPTQSYDQQAFHVSEKSRARTLLELLTESNANIREGVDPTLLEQEQSLQNQLDGTETRRIEIYNNPDGTANQKAEIEALRSSLLTQYKTIQDQIRRTSPKYAALKYPEPFTLSQVQQQLLDQDTTLIQYALGRDKSYLWLITKDGYHSYELPSQTTIAALVKQYRDSLTNSRGDQNKLKYLSSQLSEMILGPVRDRLTTKQILVVADGSLNEIPFSSLINPNQKDSYLMADYQITNLPSSSVLSSIRQESSNRPAAPKTLALIADPVFAVDDCRVTGKPNCEGAENRGHKLPSTQDNLNLSTLTRSAEAFSDLKWNRLLGTRTEAQALMALVPEAQRTQVFDFDANRNFIEQNNLDQYQIVHFATHGFLNDVNPDLSGIVLSLVNKQGQADNGFLRLNDIFNLKLGADLVILSACQTALGNDIKGEGAIGLSRGLMYAGASRLVLSLWSVNDEATAEFMTRFYQLLLNDQLTPNEALRQTQIQMQTETPWKHPNYWAAFTIQGEYN